ncbi:MAG TPA: AAA family ATPase [Candidatus Kapabacteria bacterium]|nr:AAA family ATPase [Candidatus Kapabacteria bacterium]
MQKITIKNFGPILGIELPVKEFLLFIGPQASGKSTISKTIFFFKSLRDDLVKYIFDSVDKGNIDKPLSAFSKATRKKFLEFWGPTQHLDNIFLQYNYNGNTDVSVTITLEKDQKYVKPDFSPPFKKGFTNIIFETEKFIAERAKENPAFLSSHDLLALESEKKSFYKKIEKMANELFNDDKDLIFIPAGRSLLATLSDQLQNIHPFKLDYLMRAFVDRINHSKPLFNKSLSEMVYEKEKLTQDKIEFAAVEMAGKIIEKILKGSYRFDREGEKLYFDNHRYMKLNFSSSGQQEAIWILLLIFLIILENKKVFVVIEEPEAHLYPEAQKDMVDLISLLTNYADNQTIITTHSPYILASINNLIYAKKIGDQKPAAVRDRINPKLWCDKEKMGTYFIDKGGFIDIMAEDLGLIKTEAIDSASNIINDEYEFLFDLDE